MKTKNENSEIVIINEVYKVENPQTDIVRNCKSYDIIKPVPIDGLNRKVSKLNVRLLKEKMKKNGFTTPILIIRTRAFSNKSELFILDGQHRFCAAQQLNEQVEGGFGFNYEVRELKDDTIENVSELIIDQNDCSHNWQNGDYRKSGLADEKRRNVENGIYQLMEDALKHKSSTGVQLKGEDVMHIFVGGTSKIQIEDYRHKRLKFTSEKRKDSMKKLNAMTKSFGGKSVLDCVPKSFTRRGVYEIMRNELDDNYERVAKFIVELSSKLEKEDKIFSEGQIPFLNEVGTKYKEYYKKLKYSNK